MTSLPTPTDSEKIANNPENGGSKRNLENEENCGGESATNGERNGDGDGTGYGSEDPDMTATFNSDLLCEEHGDLRPNEACRRLVSDLVWKRLRCLFPACPEFLRDAPVCPQCTAQLEKEQEMKFTSRQWEGSRRDLLTEIVNVPLLCNHGKLLYPVDQPEANQENGLMLMWEEEWKQLTRTLHL
nr:hypothetical protein BaRGS_033445 [Batillaria attramentaria]